MRTGSISQNFRKKSSALRELDVLICPSVQSQLCGLEPNGYLKLKSIRCHTQFHFDLFFVLDDFKLLNDNAVVAKQKFSRCKFILCSTCMK